MPTEGAGNAPADVEGWPLPPTEAGVFPIEGPPLPPKPEIARRLRRGRDPRVVPLPTPPDTAKVRRLSYARATERDRIALRPLAPEARSLARGEISRIDPGFDPRVQWIPWPELPPGWRDTGRGGDGGALLGAVSGVVAEVHDGDPFSNDPAVAFSAVLVLPGKRASHTCVRILFLGRDKLGLRGLPDAQAERLFLMLCAAVGHDKFDSLHPLDGPPSKVDAGQRWPVYAPMQYFGLSASRGVESSNIEGGRWILMGAGSRITIGVFPSEIPDREYKGGAAVFPGSNNLARNGFGGMTLFLSDFSDAGELWSVVRPLYPKQDDARDPNARSLELVATARGTPVDLSSFAFFALSASLQNFFQIGLVGKGENALATGFFSRIDTEAAAWIESGMFPGLTDRAQIAY